MENLKVPYAPLTKETALEEISHELDRQERHRIQTVSWPAFSYKPEVSFSIVHNNDCIFLKYFISEKWIRALYRRTHDPVFLDSCVEFFISFDGEAEYYNLEFNCIGTCLLGYGAGKAARRLVPEDYVKKIRRQAIIKTSNDGGLLYNNWELTLVIPLKVFIYHSISSLKNRHCRVNLFKCGDELPEPHFLAWNPVQSASPNFHLPEFFGSMHFVCQ